MNGKRAIVLLLVLALLLLALTMSVLAQGGRPDNPGGGGGGRPLPTFVYAEGTLSPYGEGLGFVYDGVQYVIDFGPEWYVPNDCLRGLVPNTSSGIYTLQNGRYTIDLTCVTPGSDNCAQVSAPGSPHGDRGNTPLWLASPRPGNGDNIAVWGMTETKEGYKLLRAWEIQWSGTWRWWRWDGQPWQKAQFLSCNPAGEGE